MHSAHTASVRTGDLAPASRLPLAASPLELRHSIVPAWATVPPSGSAAHSAEQTGARAAMCTTHGGMRTSNSIDPHGSPTAPLAAGYMSTPLYVDATEQRGTRNARSKRSKREA